jgi:uncharacterized protein YdeI (YjbR/CyaY-like superfamily)
MGELPRVRPKSRTAWRDWLDKNHASSTGVWLVYAKKHSRLPSLTYNDAVEEALCFGWIDSKINPIDDAFYMQIFTPRKLTSAWSRLNKARVERLLAAGLMTSAGVAVVKAAKSSGTWDATKHVEELAVPPDLEMAIKANPEASRHWASYSASRRKGVLSAWPAPSGPIPERGTFRRSLRTWPAICPGLNAWRGPASDRSRRPRDRRNVDESSIAVDNVLPWKVDLPCEPHTSVFRDDPGYSPRRSTSRLDSGEPHRSTQDPFPVVFPRARR